MVEYSVCTDISFAEAKALMDAGALVLDVREEYEYLTGHAQGAVLFPLDTINAQTAARTVPEKETPVLTYCRSGLRSTQAVKKLRRLGYTHVYNIGSLSGWPYGLTVEYE